MANDDVTPPTGDQGAEKAKLAQQFGKAAPDANADEGEKEFEALVKRDGIEKILDDDDYDNNKRIQEEMHAREQQRRDDADGVDRNKKLPLASFNDPAKGTEPEGGTGHKYEGNHFKDFITYGLRDKGSFYQFNSEKITDKQLRRMIIRAHCDKNWSQLFFYGKDGKLDQQLTSRATNIVASFKGSESPILREIAKNMHVSPVSMREVEPFKAWNPLAHVGKGMENWGRDRAAKKDERLNSGGGILGGKGAAALVS